MQYWIIQTLNSLALGGLLFLLAAGFSLIFGLMRIANLTHGSMYMLGAYVGVSVLKVVPNLWLAALFGGLVIAVFGGLVGGVAFPTYRLVVLAIAVATALALHLLMDRTRIGAMIRAGVDDMQMARAVGIPVSWLFTAVFCLGAALAGAGGIIGGPIMSAYPGLDADMLPLALIVVMLGGVGSLLGAFVGSFLIGAIYTFGTALLPDLAYVILFLPMIVVIAFRPTGLFGRRSV